jgi:hypothetical protein
VPAGEDEHGVRDVRQPVLHLDVAVAGDRGGTQDVGRVHGVGHRRAHVVDARIARVGEVERELVGEQGGDLVGRPRRRLRAHDEVT